MRTRLTRVVLSLFTSTLGAFQTAPSHAEEARAWNRSATTVASEPRLLSAEEVVARLRQLDPEFPDRLAPNGAIGCKIEDAFGNAVNTVTVLEQSGEPAYWLQYLNDGEVDQRVRFSVVPLFEGSPLAGQQQLFLPNDACNIATPFGIPFWGLNLTSGPWLLTIRNDRGGVALCQFQVVP